MGAASATGLPGTIDEIGYLIDPNQHTAVIKGYVENPGKRIRAGQYVTATVNIPPPDDVVEIPTDALVDDGLQSLVFVQPDAAVHHFTMRRVQVTQRFERTVFVRTTPIPKEEQLTAQGGRRGPACRKSPFGPASASSCPGRWNSRPPCWTSSRDRRRSRPTACKGESAIGVGPRVATGEEAEDGQGLTGRG